MEAKQGQGDMVALHALQPTVESPILEKVYQLSQKGKTFVPSNLMVHRRATVDLSNDDVVYHNVFSLSKAKKFDLGLYPHGDHREVMFDKAGLVRVFCAIHPDMFAQVFVVDTPWFVQVDAGGSGLIRDVPKGRYDLRLWHSKEEKWNSYRILEIGSQNIQVNL